SGARKRSSRSLSDGARRTPLRRRGRRRFAGGREPKDRRLAPSPAVARGSLALGQARTSALDRAARGRRGTVLALQDLRIGIGRLAAGKFPEPFEFLDIELRLVQLRPQFGERGPDEKGGQAEKAEGAV